MEPSVLERAWGSIERVTVKAPALHSTVQRLRPERNVEPIMELLDMLSGCRSGELPPEYFKDPALSLRRRIHINTVAIAHFGDMLPPLVQLHSGELPPTQ